LENTQLVGTPGVSNLGDLSGEGVYGASVFNAPSGIVSVGPGDLLSFEHSGDNEGEARLLDGTLGFDTLVNRTTGTIVGSGALVTENGLQNEGLMAFGASTHVVGDVDNRAGGEIVVSGPQPVVFFDDVLNNGSLFIDAGSSATFFGSLSGGAGASGPGLAFVPGDLDPGNSPAAVGFGGDLTLSSTSSLTIELGGLIPGPGYDQVNVEQTMTLGGALNLELISGFNPAPLDTFEVLTA
jgi:hypothetical protein